MFKRHRTVSALLVVVLILGILAACSGNNNSNNASGGQTTTSEPPSTPEPQQTPAPAPEPEPEPEPEPVNLVAYSNNADADFEARFAQAALKKYPHFTFEHHSSAVRNLKDTIEIDRVTPDIGYGVNIADYRTGFLPKNLARDITDLIEAADFDLNQFDPGTIQTIRNLSGGKLYGLPNTSNPIVLFYNKDIFDAFNVPYPTDGMTWDEVFELAQKVTGEVNGTKYVGFGSFHQFLFGMNQLSLPLIDDETGQATVNNAGFKQLVENLLRFYQIPGGIGEGYNPDGNGNDDLVRFYEQKDLAMVVSLLSSVNRPGFDQLNWDMVTAPTFPDRPGIGFQDGVNFNFISSTSENPEAAFQALAEYYSEENQIELAKLMIVTPLVNEKVRAALGEAPKLQGKNVNAVYGNQFAPTPTPHPVISITPESIFAPHFSKLVAGVYKSVDEMLAAADAAINEAIRNQ
jgi:multiple sugar transport system substrate-binding protein